MDKKNNLKSIELEQDNKYRSMKSEYLVMTRYLLFLYKQHLTLELEIMIILFLDVDKLYHEFISGHSDISVALPFCTQIKIILKSNGLPTSFNDFKKNKVVKIHNIPTVH